MTNLRRDINRLERKRRGKTGGKVMRKFKDINATYRVNEMGINLFIEELKQRLIVKKTKVKRYQHRISQF